MTINLPEIIKELEDAGLSQQKIANGIGHGIVQSTVHDMKVGRIKSIRYERGVNLLKLHKKHCKQSKS